ncbi:MAG: NAD(P)-dependent oxidoreductase [Ancalomicrobiaceae bacterium]|nr:NAD(P)-dependent oxidoreductase [Ancalomicrobiaceae bacterium]
MDIAFIGLGTMGQGIVRNLLRAGNTVTVWNRSARELPPELAAVKRAASIAEAINGKKLVMVCVTGPDAQQAIYDGDDGLVAHLGKDITVADVTSTRPELSVEIAKAVAAKGSVYLDTPVFGSKGEAWDGKLDFVCGGPKDAFDRLKPVLEPLAATIHYMGGSGSGASMKLVGNLLVAAQLESLGEALALATKAGLDGTAVMGVFDVADYSSLLIRNVGRASLARNFAPSFYLKHMLKDARLISDFARRMAVPVPVTVTIGELYQAAVNKGLGDLNASGLHKMQFELAGLKD